ncbi:hypothetical protein HO133_010442 [Letharia lupina]|uniref:Rhodopsin domain-containing protein n=1 Tax=Letharia lupina TaxID=560253 RepID=A0A8H6FEB7_9LECA|nr:uncharacterized protein HO133_010442 [Letharia lupina]KAF6225245.1 hypothetical protein HO133_010442 [Letharia lupina]
MLSTVNLLLRRSRDVLSSASAASASSTSSTSSSTSASPSSTTSDRSGSTSSAVPVLVASPTSASASSTSSVSPALETFGAGTHGTTWGNLPADPSNANRGPAFEAVSIILLSVAALVLAFRFFARIYTKRVRQVVRGVGPDEWFALMTLIITAGVTADIIVGTEYGMGKHMSLNETSAQLSAILKGAIFQCVPINAFWAAGNPLQSSKCIGILAFNGFNSAWSSLEDLVIWVLPIPVIWKLKVPFSRKMGLWVLVAISSISVVCAIVRMASLIIWMRSIDISWNYPLIPFLSNMEVCVGIMTSSVPAIYPLFRRSAREQSHSDPAPPPMGSPETSWVSQDSHDETAVPSTADRSSKRWSFLSRKTSTKPKLDGHGYLSTLRSEYGPRTELRSVFETEEVGDFIPGLAK